MMQIGVVMPAYNAEQWIRRAIDSVLDQSNSNWSMVIVDDGSSDATAEIAGAITDQRVRLVRQANGGVSAARNRGMNEVLHGCVDALIFLDADDWLAPDAFARLSAVLESSPGSVGAVGAALHVDTGHHHVPPSGDILERFLAFPRFGTGAVLLRLSAVQAAGGFDSRLTFGEDWEFLVRIALQGSFVTTEDDAPVLFHQPNPGGLFRRHSGDPAAYAPCMQTVFGNPALLARLGRSRLDKLRRRADANNAWAIGRELIRDGRPCEGKAWLRRSLRAAPSIKRIAILLAVYARKLLPGRWLGPFQPYAAGGNRIESCSPDLAV
jgi:glycosyltransferase involved in cell wall biosynthesis